MAETMTTKIFSGTNTAVWINSKRVKTVSAVQAKVAYTKNDISMCGQFYDDSIIVGAKGTGSITVYKSDSTNLSLIDETNPNKRNEIVFLNDTPDANGRERIRLSGVTFDDTTLGDYEARKEGSVTLPFTFTGWKALEKVEATI